MSKVSYTNLKLKVNTENTVIQYNDQAIEVLKYLPIEDKISLINIVLQHTLVDNIYSPILMDMYFHLYLIYLNLYIEIGAQTDLCPYSRSCLGSRPDRKHKRPQVQRDKKGRHMEKNVLPAFLCFMPVRRLLYTSP